MQLSSSPNASGSVHGAELVVEHRGMSVCPVPGERKATGTQREMGCTQNVSRERHFIENATMRS